MTDPRDLPDQHPWKEAHEWDRLAFSCTGCGIQIPVTANDTQAGIILYCPSCDEEMEYDFAWREGD